jgi:hypothetical protein
MFFCAASVFALAAGAQAESLREGFKSPPPGYGEVPFWWWTGEKLTKERLAWQIGELAKAGVSGAQVNYTHLRSHGWRTAPAEPPIFSDEWWEMFAFAAEECAKHGMGIGLSGYTIDWPGRDNLFRQLGITADELCGRVLKAVPDASVPHGIRVVPQVQPATLDPLNPESARRVISRFLDPFLQRVPKNAHKALNYFFQDELRLSGDRNLWCDDFPAEFKRRKGYDVMPLLPALFKDIGPDTVKTRLDYNDVMTQLEGERYFKPIFEWHASRGLIYACDPATRGRRPDEFGDYMRAMRWYTAPGFDTPGTSADPVKNKVGSSIAHLYRRPRVWLEGYHSQGWQASTATIFNSSVHNYVYGASLFNLHGLYYTTYGGWWEWAPPCYHFRMPYWAHMPHTLKYFERLSWLLTRGDHVADVAILNPLEPVVAHPERGKASVALEHKLIVDLAVNGSTDCDVIDADSLARAEISDGALCVSGERYRVLVLPGMFAIHEASLAKVRAFAAAGGKVLTLGDSPEIAGAARSLSLPVLPVPDFRGPKGVKALHRHMPEYDVYFLVDLDDPADCTFRAQGYVELWDPWEGGQASIPGARVNADGTTTVRLNGRKGVPMLVVFARDGVKPPPVQEPANAETLIAVTGPWSFSLKPTLWNKWGDYRLPAFDGFIGAELRHMTLDGRKTTLGYGPQFLKSDGSEFSFSWRYGVEGFPAFQDKHHGLNKIVGDDFFILGPYKPARMMDLYDVAPPKGVPAAKETFKTFVYAPEDCDARVECHGTAPFSTSLPPPAPEEILVDGRKTAPGSVVRLKKGYTPFSVSYCAYGRASAVLVRTDVASRPSEKPLSMKWLDDPAVLKFDPYAGARSECSLTAVLPPACRRVSGVVKGEIVSAKVDGKLARVEMDGERFSVVPAQPAQGPAAIELRVRALPGFAGGLALPEELALECGEGRMELGDWARVDGLRTYSGGAVYKTEFSLERGRAARRCVLDLGGVGVSAGVRVNGGREMVRTCPPYEFDISEFARPGVNSLEVTVYNTLNNHVQTIPTRYRVPVENAPSGLIGPVVIR